MTNAITILNEFGSISVTEYTGSRVKILTPIKDLIKGDTVDYQINETSLFSYDAMVSQIEGVNFTVSLVDSHGGGEGEGESVYRVFAVINNDTKTLVDFVKVNGSYYSYDGTTYDGPSEWEIVSPKEKTIIVFE